MNYVNIPRLLAKSEKCPLRMKSMATRSHAQHQQLCEAKERKKISIKKFKCIQKKATTIDNAYTYRIEQKDSRIPSLTTSQFKPSIWIRFVRSFQFDDAIVQPMFSAYQSMTIADHSALNRLIKLFLYPLEMTS